MPIMRAIHPTALQHLDRVGKRSYFSSAFSVGAGDAIDLNRRGSNQRQHVTRSMATLPAVDRRFSSRISMQEPQDCQRKIVLVRQPIFDSPPDKPGRSEYN